MSDEQPQQPARRGWEPRDRTIAGPPDAGRTGGRGPGPGPRTASRTAPRTATAPRPGPDPAPHPGAHARAPRTGPRRLVPTWRMALGTFLTCALVLIGGFVAGYMLVHIPPANATAVAQSNVYFYEDGTQIARDGEVNRENVELAQVPGTVQHAVLAAEDRGFYTERAVDPLAMVRAGWNTLTGKGKQSGSTITQQYVKNYYLGQEQTVTRKVKEFFIAIKLDREQSKSDILKGYLNTSYFGRNAYGIQAAAMAYYGKDVDELDTAEGAYLASLLNAPSAYDVTTHPENRSAALARWNYVVDGMVERQWLTAAERSAMAFPTPQTARPATGLSGQRGYIVQAVEDYLTGNGIIDDNTLARGGYRITTTLEKPKQDAFIRAVDEHVHSRRDEEQRPVDRNVRVGGAAIDPSNGRVVALYGGIDYTRQYVNNATRRDYQVGSTFKPFVLAAAVEHGSQTRDGRRITPATVYDGTDRREVVGSYGPVGYAPENEDNYSYGRITVRTATDESVNSVYAQMAQDVGPGRVRETAIALGIPAHTPDLTSYPSIALGVATASVLDMAKAYATLANHGRHGTYTIVESISKGGEEIGLPEAPSRQAISREAADTTTSVLQSVVANGTGAAAGSAGRPAAGKTGTAEDDKAAWFAGYTPDLATVVAVMGQDPDTGVQKPLYGALGHSRVGGGGPSARIWGQFTAAALEGTDVSHFDLELEEGADGEPPSSRYPSSAPEESDDEEESEDPEEGAGAEDGATASLSPGDATDGPATGRSPTLPGHDPADGGAGSGGATTGGLWPGGSTNGGPADGGADSGGRRGSTGGEREDSGGRGDGLGVFTDRL
ncbi:transglycosylase domain-containing protein [Streptomyces sp. FIT100]|uniref:transglycosylase domain-containing protein n=1 Tax=Streptomyces sp. FIT100 TaxID=2837956 RepID=UPI0037D9CABD